MAQHGIGFTQLVHAPRHGFHGNLQFARELFLFGGLVRHKFVERRIDQAGGDREAIHGLEDADKIAPLKWQESVERLDPSYFFIRQDHFLNGALPLVTPLWLFEVGEEHMLGAAKADTLSAKLD